jgi:hypothetical protein
LSSFWDVMFIKCTNTQGLIRYRGKPAPPFARRGP